MDMSQCVHFLMTVQLVKRRLLWLWRGGIRIQTARQYLQNKNLILSQRQLQQRCQFSWGDRITGMLKTRSPLMAPHPGYNQPNTLQYHRGQGEPWWQTGARRWTALLPGSMHWVLYYCTRIIKWCRDMTVTRTQRTTCPGCRAGSLPVPLNNVTTGPQPRPFFLYYLWLLSLHNGRGELLQPRLYDPKCLKYLWSGPKQKTFTDP